MSGSATLTDPPPASVEIERCEAAPQCVRKLRNAAADLALRMGAGLGVVEDIRLVVSEAATNVVIHAYRRSVPGPLRMLLVAAPDELVITIEDDGCGLSSTSQTPGLGAGLKLMQALSEACLIHERPTRGTTVQLRFRLQ